MHPYITLGFSRNFIHELIYLMNFALCAKITCHSPQLKKNIYNKIKQEKFSVLGPVSLKTLSQPS